VTVDTTPPAVSVESPPESSWVGSPCVVRGTVEDSSRVTLKVGGEDVPVRGAAWQTSVAFPDGDHVVEVLAVDAGGLESSLRWPIRVDTREPEIRALRPDAARVLVTRDRQVEVVVEVHDRGRIESVRISGAEVRERDGRYRRTVPLTGEGRHDILVEAEDEAGHRSHAKLAIVSDRTPPVIEVTEPAAGSDLTPGPARVRGTVEDSSETRVLVGGQEAQVNDSRWEASIDLPPGAQSLRIEAVDAAGNEAPPLVRQIRARQTDHPAKIAAEIDGFSVLGRNPQGLYEYRHDTTGIVMVLLSGGTFSMGTPYEETGAPNERPPHEVSVDSFLIAKYEVSQAEWKLLMAGNPSGFRSADRLPVERVTWIECREFCARTGLELPTEAEWEYACRAGTTTPFSYGDRSSPSRMNHDGRFPHGGGPEGEYRGETVAVDHFPPNGFGVHGMHANVMEWCEDIYDPDYYRKPAATGRNPRAIGGSTNRVIRGGSWTHHGVSCRAGYRHGVPPSLRLNMIGFRPVFRPDPHFSR
jgi:formylglycine-generating enzyme required for sulfatase activity